MSQRVVDECIYCKDGYYRDNIESTDPLVAAKMCHLRGNNHNCKKPHPLSQECEECDQPNMIKHNNLMFCSLPIDNCNSYNI